MSVTVKNFDSYQHRDASRRRRGGLLFIRIDVGTRREPEFIGRGGRARYGQWCAILEWAGETANKLPCEPGAWRREFGSHWAEIVAWFVNNGKLELSDLCPTCARLVPNSDNGRDKPVPNSETEPNENTPLATAPAGKPAGRIAGLEEKRGEKEQQPLARGSQYDGLEDWNPNAGSVVSFLDERRKGVA